MIKVEASLRSHPELSLKQQVGMLLRTRQAWYVAVYSALIYASIATLGAIWGTRVLMAMGLNNGLMLLFDTVNPVIFGLLVSLTLANRNSKDFSSQNFDYALAYIPFLCLLALAVSVFLIRETYCRSQLDVTLVAFPASTDGA